MSDHQEFLAERDHIDVLIDQGYKIKSVQENLSGAFVAFENKNKDTKTLHVKTANGRKYFSNIIVLKNN
ncbi:hypothetical protein [Falsibacillus albus]|uniref:Uncharacterized protein n=1 Tax=Falsibacillus albus TaxID=2478915 RepID=A0A3L7K0N8_9BACI|nr:hypothetical protein [Falsibacillus albus]RLQ95511.1 hypothetical protein D9X91_10805 [Falsibacillus albus]